MKLFNKNNSDAKKTEEKVAESPKILKRPRICCLDLNNDVTDKLEKNQFNIFEGTLGDKLKVPNKKQYDSHQILLNHQFPKNLHEYDILIIDLDNFETKSYDPENHKTPDVTGKEYLALTSTYPETLFDPRPLTSSILRRQIQGIGDRTHLILVFAAAEYSVEYQLIKVYEDYIDQHGIEEYNIYSFLDYIPTSTARSGFEMDIVVEDEKLAKIISENLEGATYNQTFFHPTTWENQKKVEDPAFYPLITNLNGEIVSYCKLTENFGYFIFPQFSDKSSFLKDFLSSFAPTIFPELFPYSTRFDWKKNESYWLPNHAKLLEQRKEIKKDYEKALEQNDQEIKANEKKFSFLHDILTESGTQLVNAVSKYLNWLGFDEVRNMDKIKSESDVPLKEEDLQVELDDGLLIIEVKGIGGTSTDSDCNQVSKFKHRRCKERNSFDVYALYLVNHQRYLPPIKRENPPFTEQQIEDAKSDERGLLTTWQLFNLYFDIEDNILTKEEAREQIISYGLVKFRPKNLEFVARPKELHYDNYVCIIELKETKVQVGDELLVEKDNRYQKTKILEIKVDDSSVKQSSKGEVGIKFDRSIKKGTSLWKRK